MPNHERKEKAEAAGTAPPQPPKGWMGVRVGLEGEEQQRFVVPVAYLSHPLFAELLDESAEEYGFRQSGAITIPCAVDHFRHVQDIIDRESGGGIAGLLHRHHHHDDHHQQQQQQHHDDHDHHRQQQQQQHHDDHDHHQKQQQEHHHDHHHDHHQQQQHHHHLPHFTACFGAP